MKEMRKFSVFPNPWQTANRRSSTSKAALKPSGDLVHGDSLGPYARFEKSLFGRVQVLFGLFRHSKDWWVMYRSELFDAKWYTESYSESASYFWGPSAHYLIHGAVQGLDPHPLFDTSHYLETNRDIGNVVSIH